MSIFLNFNIYFKKYIYVYKTYPTCPDSGVTVPVSDTSNPRVLRVPVSGDLGVRLFQSKTQI